MEAIQQVLQTPTAKMIVSLVIMFVAISTAITLGILWYNTIYAPRTQPNGAPGHDYSVVRTGTVSDYLTSQSKTTTTTPMLSLQVATASFGGIFTEDLTALNPYIGTVDPEAARLQVLGGARAIVFDIWPDPADPTSPVVATMKDDTADGPSWLFGTPAWWLAHGGLNSGTGRFSNWKMMTRNKIRAGTMMNAAVSAATDSATNPQWSDPFFLILCLHGAMTPAYLNTLAADLRVALNGKGIAATVRPGTENTLCAATVDKYQERVCVIVCPDIQPGFQALPNVNTFQQFTNAYLQTDMVNYTNFLQTQPNTLLYSPENLSSLTQDTAQACGPNTTPTGTLVPPPQSSFCVVQPSTGGTSSRNSVLYKQSSFNAAIQTGAQFVGVNMFSPESGDATLQNFFLPTYFGKYSFRLSGQ